MREKKHMPNREIEIKNTSIWGSIWIIFTTWGTLWQFMFTFPQHCTHLDFSVCQLVGIDRLFITWFGFCDNLTKQSRAWSKTDLTYARIFDLSRCSSSTIYYRFNDKFQIKNKQQTMFGQFIGFQFQILSHHWRKFEIYVTQLDWLAI